MKARLVRIGNSRGIRIPKPLIEQAGLGEEVELAVRERSLVVYSVRPPRAGWAEAFRTMAERGEDSLVDGDSPHPTRFDENEWKW
jgi:antitoxin MazE